MVLQKWIQTAIVDALSEDFRYHYDRNPFYAPHTVVDSVKKALAIVSQNNLAFSTGGNEGSGIKKAHSIAKGEPMTHAQLKRMKAFFDANKTEVMAARAKGGTLQNSDTIQRWELWGGDAGMQWVEQQINDVHDSNDTSKKLRPKGTKTLMDPNNTRNASAHHFNHFFK